MKTNFILILILSAIAVTGCKSGVSLEDMQKQKSKAMSELSDARKELVELAEMKEQYSIDAREEQVKVLEKRQKQMNKDIKSINNVETSSAQNSANSMVDNLKKENDDIGKKITGLKSIKKEDWTKTKEEINQQISSLQQKVEEMTSNLEAINNMDEE